MDQPLLATVCEPEGVPQLPPPPPKVQPACCWQEYEVAARLNCPGVLPEGGVTPWVCVT